ncbi:ABC transporter substrate-binding protein [Roseateles sp. DC23W]|uniref:Probable sugar-binding periplasmic protein n=1 Tax=Pelomonas dachongensis TaxID=3299029 RepID=A0ABW7ER09_9BURK
MTRAAIAALLMAGSAHAADLELLHGWTSGSEAAMVAELAAAAKRGGVDLKATAVAGSSNANTLLKARFLSGQPPALAQTDKPLRIWAEAVPLADLGAAVNAEFAALPHAIAAELRDASGATAAVPLNVHRLNTLWSNLRLLRAQGLAVPRDWDEFHRTAARLRAQGLLPLAIGSSAGQKLSLFVAVVLGRAGRDYFERALVQADPALLADARMAALLQEFRSLKSYTDAGQVSRDWAGATALLLQGRAVFQFTGDWANGEFQKAGWQPGRDYDCTTAPGNHGLHYFEFDRLVFFGQAARLGAQRRLAAALLQPAVSTALARTKGGIPVRRDADLTGFNACAQRSAADFRAGEAQGALVLALSARLGESAHGGLKDVLSAYWASERMTVQQAQTRLAQALRQVD